jgi:hypothetical protein
VEIDRLAELGIKMRKVCCQILAGTLCREMGIKTFQKWYLWTLIGGRVLEGDVCKLEKSQT